MSRFARRVSVCCVTAAVLMIGFSAASPSLAGHTPPNLRTLVLISAKGTVERSFRDLSPDAVVADDRGGWFLAGGTFRTGGVTRRGIARLRHDGKLDSTWRADLPHARVALLARAQDSLYAFAQSRQGSEIVALDAASGARRWMSRGAATALAASGSTVYVAGRIARTAVIALDATTGRRILVWHAPALTAREYVTSLALEGPRLFAGGSFHRIGGRARPNIAALDASTGRLLRWRPATVHGYVKGAGAGDVDTVFVHVGEVLTSGHDGFGVVSAASGRVLPWMYKLWGVGRSFGGDGPIVYLGGDLRNGFKAIAAKARNNLAAYNVREHRFTTWGPNLAPYVSVSHIVPSGGTILVAGTFTSSIG